VQHDRGVTILLTSHDMEDIEQTCERLLILDKGRVLFDGGLVDLHRRLVQRREVQVHLQPGTRGRRPELDAELARCGARLVREGPLSLTFDVPADATHALVPRLFELLEVHDLAVERQPLEQLVRDIFRTGGMDA
jgi:ABC-2 type transport system ATP-binding protein